jgi:hypothetical protein
MADPKIETEMLMRDEYGREVKLPIDIGTRVSPDGKTLYLDVDLPGHIPGLRDGIKKSLKMRRSPDGKYIQLTMKLPEEVATALEAEIKAAGQVFESWLARQPPKTDA